MLFVQVTEGENVCVCMSVFLCNLSDGAILARALCASIVKLSSPTAMGVPRSKVCVQNGVGIVLNITILGEK